MKFTTLHPGPSLVWDQNPVSSKKRLGNEGLSAPANAPGKWNDGWLTAPLDYNDPDGDTVKVRSSLHLKGCF